MQMMLYQVSNGEYKGKATTWHGEYHFNGILGRNIYDPTPAKTSGSPA